MRYLSTYGVVKKDRNKIALIGITVAYALTMAMSVIMGASAAGTTFVFTQPEIDNNWEADRYFPTGGVTSVTEFGRENVAQIGIDNTKTQTGGFYRTEGIKTVGVNNFGDAVEVDLYLDPAWEDTAVRAGLWVVGDNGSGARDQWFGILDFINSSECITCTSHPQNAPDMDFTGFRIWDSSEGWTEYLDTKFTYGEWVTLGIQLDVAKQQYVYTVNGVEVGTATAGENFIREVFLNSYNYGYDEFTNLNSDSYAAHWSGVVPKKVDVCHATGKKKVNYNLINVSSAALDAHLAHGDKMPGTMVNDVWFAEDCSRWELVETVTVPADKATATPSTNSLVSGTEYLLVAGGTADAGDGITFDARYSVRAVSSPTTWTDAVSTYGSYGEDLLDLFFNGTTPWGSYDSSHEYSYVTTGDGNPASFLINDVYYPNNSGNLYVDIYAQL